MIKIKPPKTRPEKKLSANEFKADLSVFLQRNRRYAIMMLLLVNLSFSQSGIVVGSGSLGTGNFVIGGNIIDTPMLYSNKFTKPKTNAIPKPRGKYKKSEAQKLKEENARKLKESLKKKR